MLPGPPQEAFKAGSGTGVEPGELGKPRLADREELLSRLQAVSEAKRLALVASGRPGSQEDADEGPAAGEGPDAAAESDAPAAGVRARSRAFNGATAYVTSWLVLQPPEVVCAAVERGVAFAGSRRDYALSMHLHT